MAVDDDYVGTLAGQFGNDIFEFNLAARCVFGEFVERRFQAVALKLADNVFARIFDRGRACGMGAEFDLRLDVIESALAVEGGRLRFIFLPRPDGRGGNVFDRGLRRAGAVGACKKRGDQKPRNPQFAIRNPQSHWSGPVKDRMLIRKSRNSRRSTTASSMPCSSRNSER